MQIQSIHFKQRASAAIANPETQKRMASLGFAARRAERVAEFGHAAFEAQRDAAEAIRNRSIRDLASWIERFELEATRRGATVLFANDAKEVGERVVEICRRHDLKKAIKSKSMLSEEASLNQVLAQAGVQPVETDLGEYICQLADDPPSHIIAPAMHKSQDEIADLFVKHHGTPRLDRAEKLTREAREKLREHFLSADLGISGGNFLIAETGSVALVTNEGNGRLVTTLPRVHIAITGIEKVVPTLEDLSVLMRLLPRSATGQNISNYFSVLTGPRDQGSSEGPEHLYFILVDNGRANLVGSELQDMLRCIRCGACMNHCPVYKTVGGHTYGWVYPGPMGSVLTPAFMGLENALDLPHAATLCGACSVVCPVKIPLPDLLRSLRERQVEARLRPKAEIWAIKLWSFVAQRPWLYAPLARWGARALCFLGGSSGMISSLPFAGGWTDGRYFPAPQPGGTFRDRYKAQRR
ncbi:MAG: LutB/LldF family L-lactate oxidation iron-sulfur protein [Burkholderiales bacterium]